MPSFFMLFTHAYPVHCSQCHGPQYQSPYRSSAQNVMTSAKLELYKEGKEVIVKVDNKISDLHSYTGLRKFHVMKVSYDKFLC